MTPEISPDILLYNILPRLPAKSVVRFKSVSKGWYSFLTTPMFATIHLHHQNRHKLLCISNTTSSCTFRTIDCETPELCLTAPRYLPFKVDTPRHVSVITSFNGLVCIGINGEAMKDRYADLILWNPVTGVYKTLSKTNAHKECYETKTRASVLYYISSEDDYRLLCVTNACNVYIYSLKSDLWRKIEPKEDFHRLSCWFSAHKALLDERFYWFYGHSALLDEKLYFLKEDGPISPQTYSIIRLDLKTERFIEVVIPFFRDLKTKCSGFTVLNGFIHVWMLNHSTERGDIELWRVGREVDGEWTKVVSYSLKDVFPFSFFLPPVHLMACGNWLMNYRDRRLWNIDPHKKLEDNCLGSFTQTNYKDIDIPHKGKYIETLVSPNQYRR